MSKDSCLQLTKLGVDAQVATLSGDAQGALVANTGIVTEMFTAGVASANFTGFTTASVSDTIFAGLAALGPSTCASGSAKNLSKDSCLSVLKAGIDMAVATAAGDAATAAAAGSNLVGAFVLGGAKAEDFDTHASAVTNGTDTAQSLIAKYVASSGPGHCSAAVAKKIAKEHCLSLLRDGMIMAAGTPAQAEAAGNNLVQTMLTAGVTEDDLGVLTTALHNMSAEETILAYAKDVTADGGVANARTTFGNFENVGAVALQDSTMLEGALIEQCGTNFLPCLFDDSDATTTSVVKDLIVTGLSPFERLGAICLKKSDVCSAHVVDQCGANFLPCLFNDPAFGAGAVSSAIEQLSDFELVGAVCLQNGDVCSSYATDQCGANFIPCLFDDATYGPAAIQSALPSMTEYELIGAVCTADADACTNYVLDQCAAFAPCLFDDAQYGAATRVGGLGVMTEADKLGALCASASTCEAGFTPIAASTIMCFVNDTDATVKTVSQGMAIAGMTGGQKMGVLVGATVAAGDFTLFNELYANCGILTQAYAMIKLLLMNVLHKRVRFLHFSQLMLHLIMTLSQLSTMPQFNLELLLQRL